MSRHKVYIGVDWGTRESAVHAVDGTGEALGAGKLAAWRELLTFVDKVAPGVPAESVAVAIERPDARIVDVALELGFAVFTINPKAVDRFRDRFSVAGAKDDRRDAKVLATSLRTDPEAFHRHEPLSNDETRLRAVYRGRRQAVKRELSAASQLSAEVLRWYPELYALCPDARALWFLSIISMIADGGDAHEIERTDIAMLLRRVRRVSAEQVVEALRSTRRLSAGQRDAFAIAASLLVDEIRLAKSQVRSLDRKLEEILNRIDTLGAGEEPTDVALIRSMPGFGAMVTAVFVSYLADPVRERCLPRLRALTGTAPVTKQSGRSKVVQRRHACAEHAREAMFHAASVAAYADPRFKKRYREARARGHSHGRAVRGVADAMLRVLVAVLRDRKPYVLAD